MIGSLRNVFVFFALSLVTAISGCQTLAPVRAPDENLAASAVEKDVARARSHFEAKEYDEAVAVLDSLFSSVPVEEADEAHRLYREVLVAWMDAARASAAAEPRRYVEVVLGVRSRTYAFPVELDGLDDRLQHASIAWAQAGTEQALSAGKPDEAIAIAMSAREVAPEKSDAIDAVIDAAARAWAADKVNRARAFEEPVEGIRYLENTATRLFETEDGIREAAAPVLVEGRDQLIAEYSAQMDAAFTSDPFAAFRLAVDLHENTQYGASAAARLLERYALVARERAQAAPGPRSRALWEVIADVSAGKELKENDALARLRDGIPNVLITPGTHEECFLSTDFEETVLRSAKNAFSSSNVDGPDVAKLKVNIDFTECENRMVKVGEEDVYETYTEEVPTGKKEWITEETTRKENRQCSETSGGVTVVYVCKMDVTVRNTRPVDVTRTETRQRKVGTKDVMESKPFYAATITIVDEATSERRVLEWDNQGDERLNAEFYEPAYELVHPWRARQLEQVKSASASGDLEAAVTALVAVLPYGELPDVDDEWLQSSYHLSAREIQNLLTQRRFMAPAFAETEGVPVIAEPSPPGGVPIAHGEASEDARIYAAQAEAHRSREAEVLDGLRWAPRLYSGGVRVSTEYRHAPLPDSPTANYLNVSLKAGPSGPDTPFGFVINAAYGHRINPLSDVSYWDFSFVNRLLLGESQLFVDWLGLEFARAQHRYDDGGNLRHVMLGIPFGVHYAGLRFVGLSVQAVVNLKLKYDETAVDADTGQREGSIRGHRFTGRADFPLFRVLVLSGGVDYYTTAPGTVTPVIEIGADWN